MILLVLTLIILFNVGKAFYNLAKKYRKNSSAYAFLGIFAFLVIAGIFFLIFYFIFISTLNWAFSISTMIYVAFAISVVLTVLVHFLLEKNWKKHDNVDLKKEIDKIGKKPDSDT